MTAFLGRLAAFACGFVMLGLVATSAGGEEAAAAAKPVTEDARLAAFFEDVFQRNLKDSPIFQAQLGMKGPDYGKWNDFSDEEAQRQDKLNRQDLERLHSEFKYDTLSERDEGQLPDLRAADAVFDRHLPLALPRLRLPDADQPGHGAHDLHAEHPQRGQCRGCRGLHLAPQRHEGRLRADESTS